MHSNYGGAEAKMIRGDVERLRQPLSGSEAAKVVGVVELEEEQWWRGFRRETRRMEDARRIREEGGTVYIKNGPSASHGSNGLSQAAFALQRLG